MQPTFVKTDYPSAITVPDQLHEIAAMIKKNWQPIHYAAVPYVEAMARLRTIHDNYGEDSGKSIVLFFLGNTQTWRGEVAKAVKDKLRALVKAR